MKELTRTSIAHGFDVTDLHEVWRNDGETFITSHTVTHCYSSLRQVEKHCAGADAHYIGKHRVHDSVVGHGEDWIPPKGIDAGLDALIAYEIAALHGTRPDDNWAAPEGVEISRKHLG